MRGDGRIFRRGTCWWIAYCHRGKEVRESAAKAVEIAAAKAASKKQPFAEEDAQRAAEALLKSRREQIAAERLGARPFVGPRQERVLVGELLDLLDTDLTLREVGGLAALKSHIKKLRGAFADRRAIDIRCENVDRYVESRLQEGAAKATVNRETALLGQALRLGVERQMISTAPQIRKLSEKGNARQGFFEKSDFDVMAQNLPDYLQGYVKFAYYSGWRRGEVQSLRWADVDTTAKVIRLRPENSKTREGRVLALEGELWSVITSQQTMREFKNRDKTIGVSAYVFHHKGQPIGDIRKSWDAACEASGLEGKLFHDLRRTAVRNMVRAGVPERVAMAVSGHKTRSIFDRYNIVNEDDLRMAMEKTHEYLKAIPQRAVAAFPKKAASK